MSSPTPPSNILSAFKPLHGGFSQALAPGSQVVTLAGGAGATWWERDVPVTAELPPATPVDGTRWAPDGKSLRVGLGTLDLAARAWRPERTLESWNRPWPDGSLPVRAVASFADTAHVAMLVESRARDGRRTKEIVVASASDDRARGRREVDDFRTLIASKDRLLVAAKTVVVLDLDANVVAEPAPIPGSVTRVREGGGMFAAIGAAGDVALVRPSDGAVLGTWDVHAFDAVPVPHGIVAADMDGNVRVGCLEGDAIRQVAEVASGAFGPIIQLVGDRIVVAGRDTDPVRVATFANPCR
jgi:hypothetical protein